MKKNKDFARMKEMREAGIQTRDRLQIDIGFGDRIYNGLVEMEYPTLLDYPVPKI